MIDIVYDLMGEALPAGYVFDLWQELVRVLPWLATEEQAGILPVRGTERGSPTLLSRRSRLTVRVPSARADQAQQLSGQTLNVAGHAVSIGKAHSRPVQAHPTLHSHLVASSVGESEFLVESEELLLKLGIECKLICGKQVTWQDGQTAVSGYSLVVHALKPEHSLKLQHIGLGSERHYGCGIFVPYKVISGLE